MSIPTRGLGLVESASGRTLSPAKAAPGSKPQLSDSVRDLIRAEKSQNTRRSYLSDNRILAAWCSARGIRAFPLATGQLAEFLASQAVSGAKAMTLVRRVAAIRHAHKVLELPDPFDQAARSTLSGIRNKLGVAVDPHSPLLATDLLNIILGIPESSAADRRDRALLLLGFAGAMRRSELVAVDVSDLDFCTEGLRVTIRRSKTDQAGQGQTIAIPLGSRPETCPVEALRIWLRYASIETGPVFRRLRKQAVSPDRLDDASVGLILKRRAEAAGLPGDAFSAHSLRSGFLTSAAQNGASIWKMIDQSRHKSIQTVRRYVRDAEIFKDHAGKGLL